MKCASVTFLAALTIAATPVLAQDLIKAASTPSGQPASGLNTSTGKWEGIAVELLTEMLPSDRKVEFVQMNFGDLQAALTSSKVDVIAASFGITPERARVVDFTTPYGSYRDVLLVPDSDKSAYRTLPDMKGKRIATSRGSAYVQPLLDAGVEVVQVGNPVEGIAELQAGRVEGLVDNGLQLRFRAKSMNLTGFRIIEDYKPISEGKLAFAARKGDQALLSMLNVSLQKAEQSGLLRKLREKWWVD